ncbi:MAG TPA: hypothetical protein DF712_21305 [Balneola sp.]|nr:hypothetical protein [Balneola sp.]
MLDIPTFSSTKSAGAGPLYVNSATVTDIKAEKGKFSEISLIVKAVMHNEQRWERTFYFNGGWERDASGKIIGWGQVSREILPFFKAVGVPEEVLQKLDETGISGAFADALQKDFSFISYLNEDNKSRTSKIVGPMDDDENLMEKFKENHMYWTQKARKKMWWPKDFKGFNAEDKTQFEMNNSVQQAETTASMPF